MTAIGYRLSAVGYRLSAVRLRLSAVGCRLSAVRCPLSAIRCPLSAGCIPESRVAPAAPGFYSLSAFRRGEAATVISSGAACWYVTDGKRSHDTLSREISHRNVVRTIRGGDFFTPQRFRRNDGGRGLAFLKSAPEGRHHHPQRQSCCRPLNEAMQPFYTTRGASRAPFL